MRSKTPMSTGTHRTSVGTRTPMSGAPHRPPPPPPTGYGSVAPLSPAGRAFCTAYAMVGVPITMLMLTATVRRLTGPLADRPRLYLQTRWGYSRRGAARTHFVLLVGVTVGVLVLLPATAFYVLEGTWTYLDSVYFCVISLCTIGLGDLVPAERPGQPLRQLYQVAVAGEWSFGGARARGGSPSWVLDGLRLGSWVEVGLRVGSQVDVGFLGRRWVLR